MSWPEAFASNYEEWSAHMTADVPFYVGLAREAAGPLVELTIGNGRVAIPVAQATRRRVIGIDTSSAMLEQARANAAAATGSTLSARTARRARCGGQRKTNGSDSSTSPDSR